LALVDSLHPAPKKPGVKVVQFLGSVGNPAVEAHATRLTSPMAQLVSGDAAGWSTIEPMVSSGGQHPSSTSIDGCSSGKMLTNFLTFV
jgi:hypothetical protein